MIEWPNDPVVILCGASQSNDVPPEGLILPNGIKATRFSGGSHTTTGKALIKLDVQVANEAQAGAYSFDIPDIQSRGYLTQLDRGLSSTYWLDGDHSVAVVFDQMNDLLHSQPFSLQGVQDYINNLDSAVIKALSAGKKVVVLQLMPFEYLDIARAVAPYGITEVISAENYAILVEEHTQAFGNNPDIIYLDSYKKMETVDGLHQDFSTAMKQGKIIKDALKDVL